MWDHWWRSQQDALMDGAELDTLPLSSSSVWPIHICIPVVLPMIDPIFGLQNVRCKGWSSISMSKIERNMALFHRCPDQDSQPSKLCSAQLLGRAIRTSPHAASWTLDRLLFAPDGRAVSGCWGCWWNSKVCYSLWALLCTFTNKVQHVSL